MQKVLVMRLDRIFTSLYIHRAFDLKYSDLNVHVADGNVVCR